jgi:hypothetical protein
LQRLEKRKKDEKRRKRAKKEIGRNTRISKVLPSLPPWAMVEQDWTPSTIMPGHLQKLVQHGFMPAAELKACHVLEDPAFPAPAEGYVVSFMAFNEQDSACHHIDSSTHFSGIAASSFTT